MTGGNEKAGLFSGLRLLLAGFEEESEKQFAEEIVVNGGQISKLYDPSCTHVIVSNLPLDDPLCCTARKDGKILVTDTWISDCLETDALVDIRNVLYRPLKDLAGIDGSKKLCMCLTGYQGLARRNIMRMVEMMGAKFSKPLIGSQVTHLLCYKFEGEKYDLARKTGMKLVNHFWLEDSLNSWTLLPESSYAQSGWEAEALRAQGHIVEDSGEDDNVAVQENSFGKQSPCEKVTLAGHTQFLNEKNENHSVDDDSKRAPKSHEKPMPRHSLSPPAGNGQVRNVGSAIDGITGGSGNIRTQEQMSTFSKLSAGDFPVDIAVGAADNRNGSSVPGVEEDESTHLYVDDGNESDHSCGRTSYEDAKFKSDLQVAEMDFCEPVDAIATSQKMEMVDFATEHTSRLTAGVPEDQTDASGHEKSESPATKRRRSPQFLREEDTPREKSSPGDEEAMDFADSVLEENVAVGSVVNQQLLAAPESDVKQESLACPAVPGLPVDELPKEMEECDPKSSFSIEASAMEISSNEAEHVMSDAEGVQGHSNGNSGEMDVDVADVDVRSTNQEAEKRIKTTNVKEKKTAPKTTDISNNSGPVTLAQVAQSYNPLRKEKRNQKNQPAVEDKENHAANEDDQTRQHTAVRRKNTTKKTTESKKISALETSKVMCFAVGGATDERTKLHSIVKILGARICRSRYQWRNEATHLVLPGPLRRTEKFLAGAAAGRWILKPEYLEASRKAGKFLEEEAYEWYCEGTNDKGSISLLAPRKWRVSAATSGVGAFHGFRVLFYGECISPPLDTMKRAIRAGGGVVLATAPPYTRHLADGVNFAIISPGIPKEDGFVQEFLEYKVACVLSEYFVDLVCHPSSSLEKHILYGTEKAARQHETDIAKFGIRCPSSQRHIIQHNRKAQFGKTELQNDGDDVRCSVCGSLEDEEVMLLCGDDKGNGCGAGTHIYCCDPPLHKVPDEDWFCSKCK